jgi:hypothetical protein
MSVRVFSVRVINVEIHRLSAVQESPAGHVLGFPCVSCRMVMVGRRTVRWIADNVYVIAQVVVYSIPS